ncbi:calcitonin gene-related peptide type 1 receptor-like [Aethina tumida]|uniref:calcitonin gene-related peptide type 1 receptor-like n=1 Tax=Aethina tumida TaxID=116153 RepID=UPI0021473A64|nr:calcitonin gene-related peptide type 1 receptor-like [Aethina tumida]
MMNDTELVKLCEIKNSNITIDGLYCPGRFDGWTCWPPTPAGSVAQQPCPSFIAGFEISNSVYYKCEEDGHWIFNTEKNYSWVNYTTCVNLQDLNFRKSITIVNSVGYGISFIALTISLGLLLYFKSLRCARILIHMNLFTSFAVNNFLWLVWNCLLLCKPEMLQENSEWCITLYIILQTFLISNYSWMLCEGLYLHTVLVWAFISEARLFKWMLVIGWGIPLWKMIIHVTVRATFGNEKDLLECWSVESDFDIIKQIPVACTIILNLIFLLNIVRVVITKLKAGPGHESGSSRSSVQALRATLLLVPLLGINYLLIPARPNKGSPWEPAYEYISAITTSLQGLCVAILFCFCNGEVQAQVKRKWSTAMFRPRANSCTVTTVSFVRSTYPANGEDKIGLGRRASSWLNSRRTSTMVIKNNDEGAQCV